MKSAQFIEMDVRDPKLVSIFEEFKPSIVFHEAAQTMVQSSMENPSYDCDVNLLGLINVLDACRKVKVEQFLMPSSAAVYGDLAVLPLTEELKWYAIILLRLNKAYCRRLFAYLS